MGEVSTKFTSDSKQIEAAYDKLYRQNVRLQEKQAQGGRAAKQRHSETTSLITREVASLKSMAAGYVTVSTAVGALSQAYRDWEARTESIGRETQRLNDNLVKQLTLTGQTQHGARIEQALSNIPGVRREAAHAAFGGVLGGISARPEMLTNIKGNLELAAAIAPVADIGIDADELGRFAGKLRTVDTARSAPAVRDLALAVKQMLGPNAGQFQSGEMFGAVRGFAQFMSPDEAIAIGMQAAAQNVPGLPRQLFDASQKVFTAPDTKGRTALTAAEAAQHRLAEAATPSERLRLIMNDQAAADVAIGTGNAGRLKLLDAGERARIVEQLRASTGTFDRVQSDLLQTEAGRNIAALRQREYRKERREVGSHLAARYEAESEGRSLYQDYLDETRSGGWSQFFSHKFFEGAHLFNRALAPSGVDPMAATLQMMAGEEIARDYAAVENTRLGFEKFKPDASLTEEAIRRQTAVMEEVRDELKAGNDERRNQRRSGATVPRVNER